MPSYKHTQPGGADSGKPTGRGQDKAAGGKPVDPGNQTRAEHEELAEKYTDGSGEIAADASENGVKVKTNNVNRNTNKPDIDNNKYN